MPASPDIVLCSKLCRHNPTDLRDLCPRTVNNEVSPSNFTNSRVFVCTGKNQRLDVLVGFGNFIVYVSAREKMSKTSALQASFEKVKDLPRTVNKKMFRCLT